MLTTTILADAVFLGLAFLALYFVIDAIATDPHANRNAKDQK